MILTRVITLVLACQTRWYNSILPTKPCFEPQPPSGYNYWDDPRIHILGNTGFGGIVHATFAPFVTKLIDNISYDGRDIRGEAIKQYVKSNKRILDVCCGTGRSTAEGAIGLDTSKEMIRMANWIKPPNDSGKFVLGNAENWGNAYEFDVVTCMFGLHEMPRSARIKVLQNCIRITNERVIIIDIHPSYIPSESMLVCEPYLLDYLENIEEEMKMWKKTSIIDGRVTRWDFYKTL
jgi:SAM-dependent methyltransferase